MKQSKRHRQPTTDRDAELDEALRDLGEEMLNREIPERLLRVLRSAQEADKITKTHKGNPDES
jgi:hypothetical protein